MRGFVQLQRIAEQVVPASMCAVRASQMNDLAVTARCGSSSLMADFFRRAHISGTGVEKKMEDETRRGRTQWHVRSAASGFHLPSLARARDGRAARFHFSTFMSESYSHNEPALRHGHGTRQHAHDHTSRNSR